MDKARFSSPESSKSNIPKMQRNNERTQNNDEVETNQISETRFKDNLNNAQKRKISVLHPIQKPKRIRMFVTINNIQNKALMQIQSRNGNHMFETYHYKPVPECDVLINASDLHCLNFSNYINDTIMDFYLKYIQYEIMTEDQRLRTHIFDISFPIQLQGTQTMYSFDNPEIMHSRVAHWTVNVDIFDKDFLILPIHQDQAWLMAVVCFPWMAGMISYDKELGVNSYNPIPEIPLNESIFATKHRYDRARKLREDYGIEPSPCILIFDSLDHQARMIHVNLIRKYLKNEWDSKREFIDGSLIFDKNTIRGFSPQVPKLKYFTDTGIFTLQYAEQFFTNPLKNFTKDHFEAFLLKWFGNNIVRTKRAKIRMLILEKACTDQVKCEPLSQSSSSDDVLAPNNYANSDEYSSSDESISSDDSVEQSNSEYYKSSIDLTSSEDVITDDSTN